MATTKGNAKVAGNEPPASEQYLRRVIRLACEVAANRAAANALDELESALPDEQEWAEQREEIDGVAEPFVEASERARGKLVAMLATLGAHDDLRAQVVADAVQAIAVPDAREVEGKRRHDESFPAAMSRLCAADYAE